MAIYFQRKWIAISLCLVPIYLFSSSAMALEFECQLPGDVRSLRVEIPGQERLCEVSVTHQINGKREVKWHARSDTMFCSAKAYELRDKYENLWGYSCEKLSDLNGIDRLSLSQREILDSLLKQSIQEASEAKPPYTIVSVKAVASTPLDNQAAKLAFQFFTSAGNFTKIVEDTVDNWSVVSTIDELQNQIDAKEKIDIALIHTINDQATLEVKTYHTDEQQQTCIGSQAITVDNNDLVALNPHRFFCETATGN